VQRLSARETEDREHFEKNTGGNWGKAETMKSFRKSRNGRRNDAFFYLRALSHLFVDKI